MIDQQYCDEFIKKVIKENTPEANEMKKIMARMIESEWAWAKEHKDEKVCSRCGRKKQLSIVE